MDQLLLLSGVPAAIYFKQRKVVDRVVDKALTYVHVLIIWYRYMCSNLPQQYSKCTYFHRRPVLHVGKQLLKKC